MTICADCGDDEAEIICEECGNGCCYRCYRQYSFFAEPPVLCWKCQNEADIEWLRDMSKPIRRRARNRIGGR